MPGRAPASAGSASAGWLPLVVWLASLAVAVTAFHWLGRTPLASPSLRDLGAWWSWAQGRTADELAFNLLRLLGVGLSWYLVGATAIGALARLARAAHLIAIADRLTVAPVRRVLQASLGFTLAAASTTAMAGTPMTAVSIVVQDAAQTESSGPQRPVVPGAIGQEIVQGSWTTPTRATLRTEAALRAGAPVGHDSWLHLLRAPADPGEEALIRAANTDSGSSNTVRVDSPLPERSGGTWVVEAGDHFWSIAEQVLAQRSDDQAIGEGDVLKYWEGLVEANRHRLVDPGNADLLLPGQVLQLPSVTR